MTTDRTRALAALYAKTYGGTKDEYDHIGGVETRSVIPTAEQPARSTDVGSSVERGLVKVQCPQCGIQATVLEQQVPALLERWRQDHEQMPEGGQA